MGTLYNAIPGQNKKDEVEKWAAMNHPEAWAQLVNLGQQPKRSKRDGSKLFNLTRDVRA